MTRNRDREHLFGEESAFVTSVGSVDDAAEFTDGQFNILERDSGLEPDGVGQHFGSERECNWAEHVIP